MEHDKGSTDDQQEEIARKAEIAERRRQTRRENLERERLQDERLAQETRGGRHAKHLAQANAVWKPEKASNPKDRTSIEKIPRKKDKETARSQMLKSLSNDSHQPERMSGAPNKGQKVGGEKGTQSARDHLSDQHDRSARTLKKANTKQRTKASTVESDDDEGTASSSAEDNQSELQSDDAGSDDDDDDDEEEDDIDEELESPRFTESLKSAHDLFNDDQNVEMGSHHRSSSRSGTLPPSTDDDVSFDRISSKSRYSSGIDDDEDRPRKRTRTSSLASSHRTDVDSIVDEEDSMSASETRSGSTRHTSRKAASQVKTRKLEKRFNDERPRVKSSASDKKKDESALPTAETVSPEVRIVRNGTPKLKLLDQPVTIQAVVREAIDQATKDVIFKKSWPEEDCRPTYGRDRLLDACRAQNITKIYDKDHLDELKTILKKDPKAAKLLATLVTSRLSVFRTSIKAEAVKAVPYYQLGLGPNCAERVKSLLNNFVFHMPGTWGGESNNQWIPAGKEAFLAPALITTLKEAYFSTPQSLGGRYISRFDSKLASKPDERELPTALLALGVTGLYCALYEFRSGHKEDAEFDGGTFLTVNEEILSLLERLRDDKPIQFHDRMHQLYKLICDPSKNVPIAHAGAFTVIEF